MYTMRLFLINNITLWKDNYLRSAGMILYHTINKNFQYDKLEKTAMVSLLSLLSNHKSKSDKSCKSINIIAQRMNSFVTSNMTKQKISSTNDLRMSHKFQP